MEYNLSDFKPILNKLAFLNNTVYLKNWPSGFGSALTCLIDNIEYFNKYDVIIKPLWTTVSEGFKYTDGKINCFYEFFDDNKEHLSDSNIVINSDIFIIKGADMSLIEKNLTNKSLTFKQRFKIKDKYFELFNKLSEHKEFTFSIHLRSNIQKVKHYYNDVVPIENVIKKLQSIYGSNCTPFIATDVDEYLKIFLRYFPNAVYNADSFRVPNDSMDSCTYITNPGVRHGEDVLLDLIGLSKGKKVYMSESNFWILLKIMFDNSIEIINLRNV
jgi:hypothetical protein